MAELNSGYFLKAQQGDESTIEFVFNYYKKIIYDCLNKYRNSFLKTVDPEDYEAEAMYALFNAIMHFDTERGNSFSVLAYTSINNALKKVNIKNSSFQRKFESSCVSLEESISFTGQDGDVDSVNNYERLIDDDFENSIAYLNIEIMVEKMKDLLSERSFEMFNMASSGYTLEQIGEKYGLTGFGVDKQLSKDRKYIRDIYKKSNQVYSLFLNNFSKERIAELLKMSVEDVDYYIDMYNYLYNGEQKTLRQQEKDELSEYFAIKRLNNIFNGSTMFDILYSRKILNMSVEESMQYCGIKVSENYLYKQSERARRTLINFKKLSEKIRELSFQGKTFKDIGDMLNIDFDEVVFFYDYADFIVGNCDMVVEDSKKIFDKYSRFLKSNWEIMKRIEEIDAEREMV
ncbi:MAG: hypothetical protein IJW59_03555 [Clostridia bacterium]|nr:hypothetical protein [Clostridia bacterium]